MRTSNRLSQGRGPHRFWFAVCLVGLTLFAGASRAATLTLAVADIPYSAPVLIAEAEGYFAAEGLALNIKHYPVGRICLEALLAGEAHFATVATTTVSGRENQIVVRTDRSITQPADLQGKRLGVIPGTSGHYFADTFMLFHGVKIDSVTEQPLDPKDPVGALVRGEVDAAALFGTSVTDALNRLGPQGRVLPSLPFFSVPFNIVSRPASQGVSDDDAIKLLRAVQRAMVLLQREPERARAIVAKALKVSADDLAKNWDGFEFRLHLSQSLITTLEAEARWALRRRLVPAGEIPDYLDLVRPEPLKKLAPRAVNLIK